MERTGVAVYAGRSEIFSNVLSCPLLVVSRAVAVPFVCKQVRSIQIEPSICAGVMVMASARPAMHR